jgi:hypothetical protein
MAIDFIPSIAHPVYARPQFRRFVIMAAPSSRANLRARGREAPNKS